jgi:uncharacterized membrane protein YcgQ (UPF0703/DUF1980 family)
MKYAFLSLIIVFCGCTTNKKEIIDKSVLINKGSDFYSNFEKKDVKKLIEIQEVENNTEFQFENLDFTNSSNSVTTDTSIIVTNK